MFGYQRRQASVRVQRDGEVSDMARIDGRLLNRLQEKVGVSKRRVYQLIDDKVRQSHLPRHLAAIALASERGINISRYASEEDLATIRQAATSAAPSPVVAPTPDSKAFERRGKRSSKTHRRTTERRRGNTVFVVHGRNDAARKALFAFLRSLSLKPLEWTQAIRRTGQGSPYVGTILEQAFHEAAAVVVLLTPDDDARLRKKYRRSREPSYETKLTGQARPNVLFEAGMAFGKNPNSTVLVQLGEIRPFSDVAGRHIVRLSNDPTSRQELAVKLANAGCNVDTTGTDWLEVGDFSA